MRKPLSFLILMLTIIILASCGNDSVSEMLSLEVKNSFSIDTSQDINFVTQETALIAADYYVSANDAMAQTRTNPVKDSFSICNTMKQPVLYVVNYENGGFVVIAADKRIEPILAYSDDGYFSSDKTSYPGGLELWIESVEERVNYVRQNNEKPDLLVKASWNTYAKASFQTRSLPYEDTMCASLMDVTVGPLLSTHWTQVSPFNNCLPLLSNGSHAFVGCVPIAIAQIMTFFQYPTNYSWNLMPNNSANTYVWELISDIHSFLGSYISYSLTGTSVNHNYDKGLFLRQKMYYTNAIQANYNYNMVENEILSHQRPVILSGVSSSGDGHAWVCDGAHRWENCIEVDGSFIRVGYLALHCNWGNGASLDGWYSYNNFVMAGTSYNHSLKMVYNIIP